MRTAEEFELKQAAAPVFTVDDEEVDRLVFRGLLRESGTLHPLRQFASGDEVIDAFIEVLRGATTPVACFLDVKMPGMTGFDVLRWIRCQRALDNVSVVMLSSSEEPHHLQEALHFGAQCYVAKFPPVAQLRDILHEAEAVAAAGTRTFKLPCNLLVATPQPAA